MVYGPTFLSLPAWRQVSKTWLQKRPPGRNLGEHRLVRRSGTTSRGTVALVFCLHMRSYPRTEVLTTAVEKISAWGRLNTTCCHSPCIESTSMLSRNDFNLYRIYLYRNDFASKRPNSITKVSIPYWHFAHSPHDYSFLRSAHASHCLSSLHPGNRNETENDPVLHRSYHLE